MMMRRVMMRRGYAYLVSKEGNELMWVTVY